MFRVEREMAHTVQSSAGFRLRRTRTSPEVRDRCDRREQDPAAQFANRVTEIHVFQIEVEPLVEKARRDRVLSPNQKTGAGDPVDERLTRGLVAHPGKSRRITTFNQSD